jgi:hypothetical protein
MLKEARAIFPDTIVARDFDRFRVTRDRIDLVNEELHDDEPFFKTLIGETDED